MSAGRSGTSNLLLRVLTAIVGIPLVLAVNYVGGWVFAVVLMLVALVGFHEMWRMSRASGHTPALLLGGLATASLTLSAPLVPEPQSVWVGIVVALLIISGTWFLAAPNYRGGYLNWVLTDSATLYVGLLLAHLGLLRAAGSGAWWVALAFVITWAYDTGAYFAGRAIGKRPFMHHVSPKKTVEGVGGGLIASALGGLIAVPALGLPIWQSVVLGGLGGIVAQTGDLVESMIKRQSGVKDSGAIIPGHGGLLDRIDSLLFVGPLVYYAARATGHAS